MTIRPMILPVLVVLACLWLGRSAPLAHHSFAAEFDVNKSVTLKGTVTTMKWVNPHSWLYIDVKDGMERSRTGPASSGFRG